MGIAQEVFTHIAVSPGFDLIPQLVVHSDKRKLNHQGELPLVTGLHRQLLIEWLRITKHVMNLVDSITKVLWIMQWDFLVMHNKLVVHQVVRPYQITSTLSMQALHGLCPRDSRPMVLHYAYHYHYACQTRTFLSLSIHKGKWKKLID